MEVILPVCPARVRALAPELAPVQAPELVRALVPALEGPELAPVRPVLDPVQVRILMDPAQTAPAVQPRLRLQLLRLHRHPLLRPPPPPLPRLRQHLPRHRPR